MELLHKDDIEILDSIIKICLENGYAGMDNMPYLKKHSLSEVPFIKQGEYARFFKIIADSGKAVIKPQSDNIEKVVGLETITKRFFDSGGFKKLYEEQQEKIKIENILLDKALDEAKVIKWTKKTYKLSVIIVVLSFIISVIALVVAIKKP